MAAIHKLRARKFLTTSPVTGAGYAPGGVGGMPDNTPQIRFGIGDYDIFLSVEEWETLTESVKRVTAGSQQWKSLLTQRK